MFVGVCDLSVRAGEGLLSSVTVVLTVCLCCVLSVCFTEFGSGGAVCVVRERRVLVGAEVFSETGEFCSLCDCVCVFLGVFAVFGVCTS